MSVNAPTNPKNARRISALFLIICLCMLPLGGCSNKSKEVVPSGVSATPIESSVSGNGASNETDNAATTSTSLSPDSNAEAESLANIDSTMQASDNASSELSTSTFTVKGSASTAGSVFKIAGKPAVVKSAKVDKNAKAEDNSMQQAPTNSAGTEVNMSNALTKKSSNSNASSSNSNDNSDTDKAQNSAFETTNATYGIDVSSYQGVINWKKVAATGTNFAIIRVGYRNNQGEIIEDVNGRYNLQEATKNGIKVGAYFFSRAISKDEAIEEANFVLKLIDGYSITYPVAYNCEGYSKESSRQYGISVDDRTSFAVSFLDTIRNAGYKSMFYASVNELKDNRDWNANTLSANNKIWVAYYPSDSKVTSPKYSGSFAMWQYTAKGTVDGIDSKVDVDIAYFGYSGTNNAKNASSATEVSANMESGMTFTDVNESVTAKTLVNLRDRPSTSSSSQVVTQLPNGTVATRTGYSNITGWSRIVYNNQTLYCVSSYLTTDLNYKKDSNEGTTGSDNSGAGTQNSDQTNQTDTSSAQNVQTPFENCNEQVTPKNTINLRSLPSVTRSDCVVVCTVSNGTVLNRIGINKDLGWSKVVYNGQTLYCVSSYLVSVNQ